MSNELKVSNEFIRKIALDNGFELKAITESRQDLKPYVYDFARALIAAVLVPEVAIDPEQEPRKGTTLQAH